MSQEAMTTLMAQAPAKNEVETGSDYSMALSALIMALATSSGEALRRLSSSKEVPDASQGVTAYP
jgi:hypothetical protein